MTDLPPLQWLRSFEAAARHLSFTAAAAELHLTQSAISQQVRLLENYLGQALFIRKPRRLELTEAAAFFMKTVQQSFTTLQQGTEAFRGKDADNVLEVKANWAFTRFWLTPRLNDFISQYPWVQLNITMSLWEGEFTHLDTSVEIRYGTGDWDDVSNDEQLTQQHCYPVCAPELAEQFTDADAIANGPLIHINAVRDDWKQWLKFANANPISTPPNEHWGTSYIITLEMAQQKLGVALAHDVLCQQLMKDGLLVQAHEARMPMKDNYFLISDNKRKTNEASRVFREWLLKELAVNEN